MPEKLVRDNVPALILAIEDRVPTYRRADEAEYKQALWDKLIEESKEVATAETKSEMTEELADLLEVIDAIKAVCNIDEDTLQYWKKRKALLSGRFDKRYMLVTEK
jgi:predicted house-cleaning noncanonical NTP pyrophosphatase (MazG superfamily)